MSSVIFYFDLVCPYSYIASQRIEQLTKRTGSKLIWIPVLLGGIYKATQAPQGKDGSASDVMPANKAILFAKDLRRNFLRFKIPVKWNPKHPISTLYAQRLLIAAPDHLRAILIHSLYKAYWVEEKDVSNLSVLLEIAAQNGFKLNRDLLEADQIKTALLKNTEEAVNSGVFGVPSFYIPEKKKLFFGADRMHFLELHLGNSKSQQPRFYFPSKNTSKKAILTFYFDFSSPWSYICSTQVERIVKECNAQIEYVPILLGALFKEIGTPNVPMLAMIEPKRKYGQEDMTEWIDWWKIDFNFSSHFPLRTVLPLRVAIVEPKTIPLFYKAAWVDNKNIGEESVVKELLQNGGFDANTLLQKSQLESVKNKLKENTDKAIKAGACGVPSFQVNGGDLIWGQDHLDVVQDLLCGWNCPPIDISGMTFNKSKM